ncbi:hypothetical protein B0H13DRAFT_1862123 [Mycena leptocephala]|nr:hypothetical protein B0H13DRAFT_1862123 [Mycena leptocephala]
MAALNCAVEGKKGCKRRGADMNPRRKRPLQDVMRARNCGNGLFSRGRIAQQTFVIEYAGNRMDSSKKTNYCHKGGTQGTLCSPFWKATMDVRILKEFVDASETNEINIARHINHSCDPNAIVELWEDPSGQNRALVISKRAISPGEEITINYGRDFKPSPCLCAKCIPGGSSSSWAGKTLNNETSTAHDDPDGLTFTDDPKVVRIRRRDCQEQGAIDIYLDSWDQLGQINVKTLNSPMSFFLLHKKSL